MSFDEARKTFYQAWIKSFNMDNDACWAYVNGLKLSQNETRHEVGMNTTSTTFQFAVTNNDQTRDGIIYKTERRLRQQDTLLVNEYGIFVAQTDGTQTDNTFELKTYGNTTTFAVADANALNSAFYSNGSFGITVNNDIVMPYRGLFNHLYKPQTQQTAALGANSPADQIRGAEDGFITAEPNVFLIGSKGYQPIITLTKALASAAAGIRAILITRGILAQNATVIN